MGCKKPVHPNDHVNMSQSSNDTYPTAMHIAAVEAIEDYLVPRVKKLRDTLDGKAKAFADIIKIGRTHLQDATPVTLGQEISGWVAQIDNALKTIELTLPQLKELAVGGTAVGTGLNSHPKYADLAAAKISEISGRKFISAPNKFAALGGHDGFVATSGALSQLAAALMKMANDVRWLASGPRSGIGELTIPENEPGSSIMPGKVNPTQSEALTMVCVQVFGNNAAISVRRQPGQLRAQRVQARARLQPAAVGAPAGRWQPRASTTTAPTASSRTAPCIKKNLDNSLMLVTALNRKIGYDNAAKIAKHAHKKGCTLKEAAIELKLLTAEEFDAEVRPERMVGPSAEG